MQKWDYDIEEVKVITFPRKDAWLYCDHENVQRMQFNCSLLVAGSTVTVSYAGSEGYHLDCSDALQEASVPLSEGKTIIHRTLKNRGEEGWELVNIQKTEVPFVDQTDTDGSSTFWREFSREMRDQHLNFLPNEIKLYSWELFFKRPKENFPKAKFPKTDFKPKDDEDGSRTPKFKTV